MRFLHWVYSIPLLLRTLFRRNAVEQELDEELRTHLEDEIEAGIHRGLTPDTARKTAIRKLHGAGLYKEQVRDAWHAGIVDGLIQDLATPSAFSARARPSRPSRSCRSRSASAPTPRFSA